MFTRFRFRAPAVVLSVAACTSSVVAQTITFDALPSEPGVSGTSLFVTANAGARSLSGVTFNAAVNSDWEIFGTAYKAPSSSDFFAASHSGSYSLGGNAFVGTDFFGTAYTGLTISTTRLLTSLYVGFDDNGNHSNDANSLTITAFGAGGDLASNTVALTSQALTLLNTSVSFGSLSGITGYRFKTTAADALNAAYGRAYVIADDLTFASAVPEPSGATLAAFGLALLLLRAPRSITHTRNARFQPKETS